MTATNDGVAAAPVYSLLGIRPFTEKYFPPTETYCYGDLAFRQHAAITPTAQTGRRS